VIHLVDTVDVRPDDLESYLAAFAEYYLTGATERGMELVGCWHTPTQIGEMVTVTVMFRLESWAHWEGIRNAGVRDPLMSTWVDKRRALMINGTRRFYEAASFSP
jgi:NIPSNAP